MDPARIAALLAPFVNGSEALTSVDLSRISTYIDILLRWNSKMNLTAVRDPDKIIPRHFGESFFAARHLFPSQDPAPLAVADVGSGAGFPGVPLKLWAPHIRLTLIESNHKKATFLREIARALTLTDIDIPTCRAESLPAGSFDLVTLRAVERFDVILPVAAALVRPNGRLALLIGSAQVPQANSTLVNYEFQPPIAIPSSHSRVLLIARRES